MNITSKLAELGEIGFCVLEAHFPARLIHACREAFWPVLLDYIAKHGHESNRGPYRHFLAMPFDPPCFGREFFVDPVVLEIVRAAMDDSIVATSGVAIFLSRGLNIRNRTSITSVRSSLNCPTSSCRRMCSSSASA